MRIFDSVREKVKDDLATEIQPISKVVIAAFCVSSYAYKELKSQLDQVDEFRFIFTSPSISTEKATKEKREFYIPRRNWEKSLYEKGKIARVYLFITLYSILSEFLEDISEDVLPNEGICFKG